MLPFTTTAPLGVIENEDAKAYHASGCIGSTILNDYLASREGCYMRHVKRDPEWMRRESPAMELGTLVHLIAECAGDPDRIGARVSVYPPEYMTPSGKASTSKDAVAWKAAQGSKLVLVDDDYLQGMFLWRRILANPVAAGLLNGCRSEVTCRVLDPQTGLPVQARLDVLQPWMICDVKTAGKPLSQFKWSVRDYGLAVQAALYRLVHQAVTGAAEPLEFAWIVQCTVYPYECRVIQPNAVQLAKATAQVDEALAGIAAGDWGTDQAEPDVMGDE